MKTFIKNNSGLLNDSIDDYLKGNNRGNASGNLPSVNSFILNCLENDYKPNLNQNEKEQFLNNIDRWGFRGNEKDGLNDKQNQILNNLR